MPYVIVSDGCSSSPDTDIGARLLAKAAEQALLTFKPTAGELPEIHRDAARRALKWAEFAGIHAQALDATLLTAHLRDDELILGCSGDGVLVTETWSGVIDIYVISYLAGYPLYPSYQHQPERLLSLTENGCTGKEVKHYRGKAAAENLRLEDTKSSDSLTEVFNVKASDHKHAVLLSDGIHSFFTRQQTETSKSAEAVPMEEILKELISFKSMRGAFVTRRLRKFLLECEARGRQQRDDLAVGALYLGG